MTEGEKKGPLAGPFVHKVEDSRRRLSLKGGKRRLRTYPLNPILRLYHK